MRHLEDFRNNDLANAYFILPGYSNYKMYKTYERYVATAFYDTFRDISNLENSRAFVIHNGSQTSSSLAFWFLALESYIATLIKICCTKFQLNFEDYKKQSLTQRVQALIQLLEIDKKSFNEFDIIGKVHEFSRFRNELFHERTTGEELEFHKTGFAALPFLSNQADAIQAALIVLEITQRFQFVFPGVNTMPLIPFTTAETIIYKQLDNCYINILIPCLNFALNKHDLNIKLDVVPPKTTSTPSIKFEKDDVQLIVTGEHEDKNLSSLDPDVTTNCLTTFNSYITSLATSEESPGAPKMVLEK